MHVYRLHDDGPVAEELEEGEETACSSWTLPAGKRETGWEGFPGTGGALLLYDCVAMLQWSSMACGTVLSMMWISSRR